MQTVPDVAMPDFRCDECKAAELSETLRIINANARLVQIIMQEKIGEDISYRLLSSPMPEGATAFDIDAKTIFASSLAAGLQQMISHGWTPTQFFQELTPQGLLYRVVAGRPLQEVTLPATTKAPEPRTGVPNTPAPAPKLKLVTTGDN